LPNEINEEKFQYKKDKFINDTNALRFETILKNLIEVIENFKPNIILLRHRIDALIFFSLSSNSKFPPNASYEKINWKKLKVKDFYYKINNYQNRPLVKAPKYARQLVQNIFLKNIKQIITISIRQNFQTNKSLIQNSYRNSNLDVWLNVANWIRDNTNFVPIIIPDIEMLNFNSEYFLDHLVFREATLDLKLRVAIYEEAFLNLSIPSGFTELLFNSLNNYLVFKFGDSRIEQMTPNSYSLILDTYGLVKDDQLPFANLKQKIYWGENSENFEFIKNRLLEYIEKYKE
jgi:hypothetical protein